MNNPENINSTEAPKTSAPEELDPELQVSEERAQQIRSVLSLFKDKNYMADLKLLVAELGTEEELEEADPELPGLKNQGKRKVYTCPLDEGAAGLSIEENGAEMKVFVNGESVIELGFLPKDHESVVFYIDESLLAQLEGMLLSLGNEVKRAKTLKSERKETWKKRFGAAPEDAPAAQ